MNDGLISGEGTNREQQMIACPVQDRIAGDKSVILLPDDLKDLEWVFETGIFPYNANLMEM